MYILQQQVNDDLYIDATLVPTAMGSPPPPADDAFSYPAPDIVPVPPTQNPNDRGWGKGKGKGKGKREVRGSDSTRARMMKGEEFDWRQLEAAGGGGGGGGGGPVYKKRRKAQIYEQTAGMETGAAAAASDDGAGDDAYSYPSKSGPKKGAGNLWGLW